MRSGSKCGKALAEAIKKKKNGNGTATALVLSASKTLRPCLSLSPCTLRLCNPSNCLKVGAMQAAPKEIKIRVSLPTNGSSTSAKKRGLALEDAEEETTNKKRE